MLWLSLYLPHLPLEVAERGNATALPLAVVEGRRILTRNRLAGAAGVRSGMGVGAAQALVVDLRLVTRDPDAETAALERLAAWAGQFSSHVVMEPAGGLLLEIGRSLRLFGGLASLLQQVRQGVAELGYRARIGTAPTPTGAWLLSKLDYQAADSEMLRSRLLTLPLAALQLDAKQRAAIKSLGISTIDDLLRLPRKGVARRLGPELLAQIDRALGERPDPRPLLEPAADFRHRLALPAEVEAVEPLLFIIKRLLLELCGSLRGRDAGVERLRLCLEHRQGSPTEVECGLVAPSRNLEHLMGLLRERLERVELTAPVEAVTLVVESWQELRPVAADLFAAAVNGRQNSPTAWMELVERLQARLGETAVRSLTTVADHRPERSWRYTQVGQSRAGQGRSCRPLWLLPEKEPLPQHHGQAHRPAGVRLISGPERIEAGWWDGGDIARDYYVAERGDHRRLWIYQALRSGRWYLHGYFG